MAALFSRDKSVISRHLAAVFREGELDRAAVVARFATTAADGKIYQVDYYNLDAILSVGYRVNSVQGTRFRQWATRTLREYLYEGYVADTKRLEERGIAVKQLRDGIAILHRALERRPAASEELVGIGAFLERFADGLALLDDYDHARLDAKGRTDRAAVRINKQEYLDLIDTMRGGFATDLFGIPKDTSFDSSINQIYQVFDGKELYPSLEEKAAMLLYGIVKNHSFLDGNKRIGAACFLYFLRRNALEAAVPAEGLAALTLFVAVSAPEEMETVKSVIVSVLNRSGNP
jgi:death-on-curing family protein